MGDTLALVAPMRHKLLRGKKESKMDEKATGKWITVDYPKEGILFMCDQCGDVQEGRTINCPDCGARMMIDYGKTPEPIPWSHAQKCVLMEDKNGL